MSMFSLRLCYHNNYENIYISRSRSTEAANEGIIPRLVGGSPNAIDKAWRNLRGEGEVTSPSSLIREAIYLIIICHIIIMRN